MWGYSCYCEFGTHCSTIRKVSEHIFWVMFKLLLLEVLNTNMFGMEEGGSCLQHIGLHFERFQYFGGILN